MTRVLLVLALVGCEQSTDKPADDTTTGLTDSDADTDADSDADTDADSDTDTDADADCTATIVGIDPADGAVGVAIDAPVVVTFSEAVTAADIALDNGATGTVILGGDGTFATFVADGGLAASTTYTVDASVCADTVSSSFTTQGDELEVDLTDHTYDIELDGTDVTWVSPAAASFLVSSLQTNSILLMVQSADTAQIDMVGAAGYEFRGATAQYPCTYALDFDPAPFTAHPAFEAGPLDATLEANDIAFDVFDLDVRGNIAEDGSEMTDVVLTGLLDTRPLASGLGYDICSLVTSFGDTCVACPDGEVGCLQVELDDPHASLVDGLVVDPAQDPTTDRYCNP